MRFGKCRVLAMLTTLAMAASAAAQEGPPSQYERVKGLEPLIGFWQGEFQPPRGPAGRVTGFCRWAANRSYAQCQWSFRTGDEERMHVATVIFGWNGKEKRLTSWSFFPEGQSTGEVSLEDGMISIAGRGVTADGEETSSNVTYEISGDQLTVTVKNAKRGEQEMPGYSFTVEKRERPGRGER